MFDYSPASDTFKADATGTVACGFACHTKVAAKDYIFTAYVKRLPAKGAGSQNWLSWSHNRLDRESCGTDRGSAI